MNDADRGESGGTGRPRWLGPAILRIAGWPIESLDSLRSQQLTNRIDDWLVSEGEIHRESDVLAVELYKVVPRLGERTLRRLALELKRHLHGTVEPLPERLTGPILAHEITRRAIGPGILAAIQHRNKHAADRADIERAHTVELERARAALDEIVSDNRFQRALSLASPSVFRQWRNSQIAPTNRRGQQRLQSTLHRYLMRAIGRATPNNLWTGVALEDMTVEAVGPLQLKAAQSTFRVCPALSVLARGVEQLNCRRPWIEELTWRRNPTLKRLDGDIWEFGTFSQRAWCIRRIVHHEPLEVLIERFSLTDRPVLSQVEAALCNHFPSVTSPIARKLCEHWINTGVLWSTACLPAFFANPWQGLDAMIETLPASEQPIWRVCQTSLLQIAGAIETTIDALEPVAMRELLEQANQAVDAVLRRYDAAVSREEDVLVVDRTAPFRFSISRDLERSIEQKLRNYWNFDRYGLGEIETQIAIRHFFDAIPRGGRVALNEFLNRGGETDPALRARSWQERVLSQASAEHADQAKAAFSRWEQELEPAVENKVHRLATEDVSDLTVALPPGSVLLLLDGSDRGALRIGGVTPEPSFFYARFSHLFGGADAFLTWQRAAVERAAARWPNLRFLDLAIRNHFNPNVTARPWIAARMIDPLDMDSDLLREGGIACNHNGRPVLSAATGSTVLLIPSARSAAYLGGLDRFASVLASVSNFLGRPPLLAPIPRFTREIESWHHLPRLMLDDAVISPERWTPDASLGSQLANAHGAERLIQWRRFVRKAGLPEFVYTFQGRHLTESLVATDSAIAIELLGQELQAHGPSIRIQEMFPAPEHFVVRDPDGLRYVSELAVAWPGDDAFWQDYDLARDSQSG